MKARETKTIAFETLERKLVSDDDYALWRTALCVLTDEFAATSGGIASRCLGDGRRGVLTLGPATQWPMECCGWFCLSRWL
jgi:hypothetical protein